MNRLLPSTVLQDHTTATLDLFLNFRAQFVLLAVTALKLVQQYRFLVHWVLIRHCLVKLQRRHVCPVKPGSSRHLWVQTTLPLARVVFLDFFAQREHLWHCPVKPGRIHLFGMQEQSVFARVVLQAHFAQPVHNFQPTAVLEHLVLKLSKVMFHLVSNVLLGLFVKDKVPSSHRCVMLDLTQIKLHHQNAHFVRQALMVANTGRNISQIAYCARRDPFVQQDQLDQYSAMQELTTMNLANTVKTTAKSQIKDHTQDEDPTMPQSAQKEHTATQFVQ